MHAAEHGADAPLRVAEAIGRDTRERFVLGLLPAWIKDGVISRRICGPRHA